MVRFIIRARANSAGIGLMCHTLATIRTMAQVLVNWVRIRVSVLSLTRLRIKGTEFLL